ncbi:MAG: HAMP domain-containing methyl-accepting chemotaxis protein, partial [Planctomycetota bacterium]
MARTPYKMPDKPKRALALTAIAAMAALSLVTTVLAAGVAAAAESGDAADIWSMEGAVALPSGDARAEPKTAKPAPTGEAGRRHETQRSPAAKPAPALPLQRPQERRVERPTERLPSPEPRRTTPRQVAEGFDSWDEINARLAAGRPEERETDTDVEATTRGRRTSYASRRSGRVEAGAERRGPWGWAVPAALVGLVGLGVVAFLGSRIAREGAAERRSRMRWTIGKKLVAGFLFVSGLVAVAGGVGLWGVDTVGKEADNIMDVQVPLADCSMEAEIALKTAQDAAGEAMTAEDAKDLDEHAVEIEDNVAKFDMFIRAIRSGTQDERGEWTSDFTAARVEGGTHKGRSFRALWEAENQGEVVYGGSAELASLADRADSIHEDFSRAIRGLIVARRQELVAESESNKAMEDLDSGSAELVDDLVALERHMDERFTTAKKLSSDIAAKGTQEAKQIQEILDRVLTEDVTVADAAMEMKASLYALRDACGELLRIEAAAMTRSVTMAQMIGEIEKFTRDFEDAYAELRGADLDAEEQALVAEIRDDFEKLKALVANMIQAHRDHIARAQDVKTQMATLDTSASEIEGVSHDIEGAADKGMHTAMASADAAQGTATVSLIIVTVAGVFVGMVLGIWISRGISLPIGEVVKAAQQIAMGDLTQKVDVRSSDETGELAQTFNDMSENLSNVVGQILNTSEQVRTASDDVSTTAQQSSAGAQQQQKGVEQISSQTGEVSSQMEEVSSQIEEMASGI